jgi:hypothetical protein
MTALALLGVYVQSPTAPAPNELRLAHLSSATSDSKTSTRYGPTYSHLCRVSAYAACLVPRAQPVGTPCICPTGSGIITSN